MREPAFSRRLFGSFPGVAVLLLLAACSPARIHRLGNTEFPPRPKDAPVAIVDGVLDHAYEAVALLDSARYDAANEPAQARMKKDLEQLARKVGADAVHKIRILRVQKRGAISDERVPIPGAWTQGAYTRHFMRGEAVRALRDAPDSAPTRQPAARQEEDETIE